MKKIFAMLLVLALSMVLCTAAAAEATIIALSETVAMNVAQAQAENAQTVWTSSDETIVTVDANGNATGLNAGEAVITAAVTTTTIEVVEKTAYEIVREAKEETGELFTRRVEKTVSEEVENVTTEEIAVNVVVEAALCPGCAAEYTNADEYTAHVQIAVCGAEGHYVCDGQDHETELDPFCPNEEHPHRICQAGAATHSCESCGNEYACEDSGSHTTCIACGNAWCYKAEGNHTTPACGKTEHRACVQNKYDKNDHYRCMLCNRRLCDGHSHGEGKCVNRK